MPTIVGAGIHVAGGTTTTPAATYSPVAGNALVLFIQFNTNSAVTAGRVTVTDNAAGGSSVYVNPTGGFFASGNNGIWVFYCLAVKSGVTTITATISAAPTVSFNLIIIDQFSGFSGYTFDVAKMGAMGPSSATDGWTTGNFTTNAANDFIWGFSTSFSGLATYAHGTNYTAGNFYGQPLFYLSEYKTAGAAGTDVTTWTYPSATDTGWGGAMAFSPAIVPVVVIPVWLYGI